VVIDDLHVAGISVVPDKANAVLVVDSDAMLAASIASEGLEPVTGEGCQITELAGGVQLLQLPLGDTGDPLQPSAEPAGEECLGLGILERPNHCSSGYNVRRYTSNGIG